MTAKRTPPNARHPYGLERLSPKDATTLLTELRALLGVWRTPEANTETGLERAFADTFARFEIHVPRRCKSPKHDNPHAPLHAKCGHCPFVCPTIKVEDPVKVFANVEIIGKRGRERAPSRYRAALIARGTGTVMYRSKVCDTREQAIGFARAYIARNPDRLIDTTRL